MTRNQRAAAAMAIATALAIPAEGLRQVAYRDPVGVLTICYGSTTDVRPGQYAPLSECKDRLDFEMWSFVMAVERCAPGLLEALLEVAAVTCTSEQVADVQTINNLVLKNIRHFTVYNLFSKSFKKGC